MARVQWTTVEEANRIARDDNDRYSFEKELGRGAFGTVLKAYDNEDQKLVAIKIVRAKKTLLTRLFKKKKTPSVLVDAAQEKDVLMKLQHENVVAFERFYPLSQKHGSNGLAIVTELCERGNLQSHLEEMSSSDRKLEIDVRVKWYMQLTEGLSFIHSKKIVHRDLKPPNILLDCNDNLKIADVGLAKSIWEAKTANQELPVDGTYHQYLTTLTGTPPYMAPEVWEGRYQMSSDVFSLGLIFVVMSELPKNPIPIVRRDEDGYCLGQLMMVESLVQTTNPTQTLCCHQAMPLELKLFDSMLQHNHHYRVSTVDVIREVKKIETHLSTKKSGVGSVELTKTARTPGYTCRCIRC